MDKVTGSTLAGTFASTEQVCLEDFSLLVFHPKQTLPKLKACVFHAECCYNVIVRCNVLCAFRIQLDFKDGHLVCDGVSVPMSDFPNDDVTPIEHLLQDCFDCNKENDKDELSFDHNLAAEILDSSYEAGNTQAITDLCTHVTPEQCEDLFKLLTKFNILFNNKLKTFTDEKIHLEVDPSVNPHHSHAHAVLHSHKSTFKKELK